MNKPILILSAAEGETFDQFKERMKKELVAVCHTRKKNITVFISPKTMKAYFFNSVKEDK